MRSGRVEAPVGRELSQLVAAAVLGWAGQAIRGEGLAASVGSQSGRSGRSCWQPSGAGRAAERGRRACCRALRALSGAAGRGAAGPDCASGLRSSRDPLVCHPCTAVCVVSAPAGRLRAACFPRASRQRCSRGRACGRWASTWSPTSMCPTPAPPSFWATGSARACRAGRWPRSASAAPLTCSPSSTTFRPASQRRRSRTSTRPARAPKAGCAGWH